MHVLGSVCYVALYWFLRIYYKLVMKHEVGVRRWGCGGFVFTDIPVVTLSWPDPAVKTSLQNVRGRLFPGTCAL